MCPQQIENATWVAWFKSNVDFARGLGVGVSAYTLMQHNGWGESVPPEEQAMNRDGSRAGVACFGTDWHAAYRQSVLDFVSAAGLTGVETDGQYEDYACADAGGDHHHNGLDGSWDVQMAATATFNEQLKQLDVYQTGADAYLFSGANCKPHGGGARLAAPCARPAPASARSLEPRRHRRWLQPPELLGAPHCGA